MLDQSPSEGTTYCKTIIKGTLLFVALPPRQFTQVVTSLTTEASCCPWDSSQHVYKTKNHSPWQWYHQGAAIDLHTIYKMSQPTSWMTTLSTIWQQKNASGIPFHHMPTSEDYGRPQTTQWNIKCGELCTLLSEVEACLHSRSYVPYPTTLPILHICPLDTFSLVNHSPNYLPLTKLMLISIVFQVANVPTTGTEVLAELINWLPRNHHLSKLLAEIQACLQPDPCLPYPVILWTHQLNPEHSNWQPLPNYLLLTSVTCNRHPRWQSTNNFQQFWQR